jgi:cytochrome c553
MQMKYLRRFGTFAADGKHRLLARGLAVAALWIGAWAIAPAQAADIQGDAAAGAQKNAMCIGCHGIENFKTGFPIVHRVPMLHGQNAQYIAAALAEYKVGDRKHPSMRAVAGTLSEQDMADLGAYFESAGPRKIDPPVATTNDPAVALLNRGGCQSCHGANFNKPINPAYPKLAGQHADYLYVALKAYQQTEPKPFIGRGNPIMQSMVKQFSANELQTLADYLESLPGDVVTVQRSRFR